MNARKYIIPEKGRKDAAAQFGLMLKIKPGTFIGGVVEKSTYNILKELAMKEYGRRIASRLDRYLGWKKMAKSGNFDKAPLPAVYRIYGGLNGLQKMVVMRKVLKRLKGRQNGIRERAIEDVFDELVKEAINELGPDEKKALDERWR